MERRIMLETPLRMGGRRFSIKVYIYIYAFPVEDEWISKISSAFLLKWRRRICFLQTRHFWIT
jgi:hypothetical protein